MVLLLLLQYPTIVCEPCRFVQSPAVGSRKADTGGWRRVKLGGSRKADTGGWRRVKLGGSRKADTTGEAGRLTPVAGGG
ncbi:hypothetical protein FRX31_025787 [Thalictrum thalictroides]|uniref:Uncharacterized protein n=1 Tax=Thalictrum thalictroides TaxID=46969 RepID=A0A7J6VIQ0_THATH|nr:hypothetical protein FRX31_025787 [Thalictrum thalictroides]